MSVNTPIFSGPVAWAFAQCKPAIAARQSSVETPGVRVAHRFCFVGHQSLSRAVGRYSRE